MGTNYNIYELSSRKLMSFLVIVYMCIFFLCLLFYHSFLLGVTGGILGIFMVPIYCKSLATKRKAFLLEQFKDLLYSLSASIQSGRNMLQGLEEALGNLSLIYEEDSPMIVEINYIVKNAYENNGKEKYLLLDFAKRSGIDDIQNFVDVYLTCKDTGGDMTRVIKTATEILMDKMEIEKEIKTLTAQKQYEGKIITAMPIIIVFFLNIFSPDYLDVMYTTMVGRIIMTLALAGIGFAYYLMTKLTMIEV